MSAGSTDAVEELIAKQAIHELLMRYCRGVDRVDADQIASAFHPDGTIEFGELVLAGDEIGPTIAENAGFCQITTHMVGNELVELHGDVAHSELYYLSSGVVDGEDGTPQLRMRAGRYVDTIERRDGEWRLKERIVVQDWCRFQDLPDVPEGSGFRPGVQGGDDPLYALIGRPKALN